MRRALVTLALLAGCGRDPGPDPALARIAAGRAIVEQMRRDAGLATRSWPERRRDAERAEQELAPATARAEAHVELSRAWAIAGDRTRALAAADRAVEIAPQSAAPHLARARLLLDDGRAAPDLEVAVRLARDDAERAQAEGLQAYAAGDFDRAESRLRAHLEHDGADAPAHLWRGRALIQLKRF